MTRRSILKISIACLLAASVASVPTLSLSAPPNFEARVVDATFQSQVRSFPMVDFGRKASARDDRAGSTDWRVVLNTGNCCENYLTSTPSGRILDFGGSYINYTDDRGKTWKSVRPIEPLINGEGAIALAPGGDIVGVEWDPYSGDHLLAFKWDAKERKWFYAEMPVHAPFYDREWIASVPGPFQIDGKKVPYISFIKGAWPSKEAWFWSTDGLNYDRVGSKFAEKAIAGGEIKRLRTVGHPEADWLQPNTNGGMFPLGGGGLLAEPDFPFNRNDWAVFTGGQAMTWSDYAPSTGEAAGRYQVDSLGRLHNVVPDNKNFTYRISTDGGHSWSSIKVPLPAEHVIEEIDFRAHGGLGIAAVAIHGHHNRDKNDDGEDDGPDVDMLYKLDISKNTARLTRWYQVGLGDVNGASGVGQSIRFDFETVTILPDGRVAMSFYDSKTLNGTRVVPALAIEGATKL